MDGKEDVVEELRKDVEELRDLLIKAERSRVKDILGTEMSKLELEMRRKEREISSPQVIKSSVEEPPKKIRPYIQTQTLKTYAWDQSDKFMKIYATVKGVETLPKENITCEFGKRSFKLQVKEAENKRTELYISTLLEDIVPIDSFHKIKTDTVLIMLKKEKTGKTWAYVTSTEKAMKDKDKEKRKPDMDEDKDPNDSMMDLMRKMYEEGDDDMKRTIAKAWTESRNKKTPE